MNELLFVAKNGIIHSYSFNDYARVSMKKFILIFIIAIISAPAFGQLLSNPGFEDGRRITTSSDADITCERFYQDNFHVPVVRRYCDITCV